MSLLSVCHDKKEPLALYNCRVKEWIFPGKENYILMDQDKWKDLACVKIDRTLFIRNIKRHPSSDTYISRLKNGKWTDYSVQTCAILCSQVGYLVPFESDHLLPELNNIISSYARPYKIIDPKKEWGK